MAKYSKGTKVRIKDSVSPNGRYGDLRGVEGTVNTTYYDACHVALTNGTVLYNVGYSVLEKVTTSSKDTFLLKKKKLLAELSEIEAKLDYMDKTKSEVFDYTEFKVYNTLQVLSCEECDDLTKAREIAKLIKG